VQTYSITNSLLHNDSAALDLAVYLLDPEPEARYTSLATSFALLTSAQRDTVAVIDIGDTITIEKSFVSGVTTTELAQELAVEGIEMTISVNTGHSVTYYTSPTTIVYELILDDPTFGIINADNALG
jgi:precorrin-3B methylase